MNKRKQSLKDRIIKKLGGYTAAEYNMLTMPAPIIKVETVSTEQIRAEVRVSDSWRYEDDNKVKEIISSKLIKELGEKVFEYAKITQGYKLDDLDTEVHCAEIAIVVNRRATDE